mmetsp:Transcript_26250/g.46937  ORF Transcript_26250/g.46937 Transcript_26250/m.46937 type:complete len:137 (-) Transcript_26250:4051-4461(-)
MNLASLPSSLQPFQAFLASFLTTSTSLFIREGVLKLLTAARASIFIADMQNFTQKLLETRTLQLDKLKQQLDAIQAQVIPMLPILASRPPAEIKKLQQDVQDLFNKIEAAERSVTRAEETLTAAEQDVQALEEFYS